MMRRVTSLRFCLASSWGVGRVAVAAWLLLVCSNAIGEPSAGERLFKQVAPSVVTVIAGDSTGSGFLVRDRRTFVTAAHVIDNGEMPLIQYGRGSFLRMRGIAISKALDLAILETEDEVAAKPLPLGDREKLNPGAPVYAIGTALGALSLSLTDGMLSGSRMAGEVSVIQVTSPCSPGMSGGPILSKDGRVIGVISFTLTEGQNLNIAVAAKHVRELLAETPRPARLVCAELKGVAPPPVVVNRPASPPAPGAGATRLSERGGVTLVRVPAGEFAMGSADGQSDEQPVRRVHLSEYWIGRTEVTVAQFRAYCDAAGYAYDWSGLKPSWGWVDDHPMVNVTWDEARAFCRWAGGDLPTEAQWEKAARGTDGRKYPWADAWDPDRCVNGTNSGNRTVPVGSRPSGASPYGCQDMAGNVWEWCLDWYGPYEPSATRDPKGPSSSEYRVLRGGSWYSDDPGSLRSAFRNYNDPTDIRGYLGFRLSVLGSR